MARISDHSSEGFPGPGGARDQHVGAVQLDQPGQAVLAPADRQRLEVGTVGDGQGGDGQGQGVAADELQHHGAGPGGADPAQHRAEPVRQVLRPLRDISRGLP
jgi:hypothetical protein